MHTQFRGLFVTLESKEWQAFEDDNGKPVGAGQTHKAWIFDPVGKVLHGCKIAGGSNGYAVDQATLDAVRQFGFGVEVDATCAVKGGARNAVVLTLVGVAAARKAA